MTLPLKQLCTRINIEDIPGDCAQGDVKTLKLSHLPESQRKFMKAVYEGKGGGQWKEDGRQVVKEYLMNIDPKSLNSIKDEDGNTALHLALSKSHKDLDILKDLLKCLKSTTDDMEILNPQNNIGRTPLYEGMESSHPCDGDCACQTWLSEMLTSELNSPRANPNIKDKETFTTPLQIAIKKKCTKCISLFVKSGESPDFLLSYMDKSVYSGLLNVKSSQNYNQYNCSSSCFKVLYDFRCILPNFERNGAKRKSFPEIAFLQAFLQFQISSETRKKLFMHPLVETFLYLKWRRVRPLYLLTLILTVLSNTMFTIYILTVYLTNCPYNKIKPQNNTSPQNTEHLKCDRGLGSFNYSMILLFIATNLLLFHSYKCFRNLRQFSAIYGYPKTFRTVCAYILSNWTSLASYGLHFSIFFSVWPVAWSFHHTLKGWQYPIAAHALFYTWASTLTYIRRFPKLGVYVEMVGKVLLRFGYVMVAYSFILIAFAVSFLVIFPNYPPFQSVLRASLQVLTMMTGEVEYVDFFYGKENETKSDKLMSINKEELYHPFTAHILYGAFVIICTIVLMNLLNGLAVEEIKELQKDAQLTRITRQIDEISVMEEIIFWNKLNFRVSRWILSLVRRKLSVIDFSKDDKYSDKFTYVICPTHTSDRCFPKTTVPEKSVQRYSVYI